jgi:hypothetical protein
MIAFRKLLSLAHIVYVRRIKGFSVGENPLFDSEESTRWFIRKLEDATVYLEYGSGGSTCFAARLGKRFTTVDSDKFFLNAVKKHIAGKGFLNEHNQRYIHADIGLTTWWGFPVFVGPSSADRSRKFRAYSNFPPEEWQPDLILIDGRFRVACALKTVAALSGKSGWTMIIDDYTERPEYHEVERFARLEKFVGRMAVFSDAIPAAQSELQNAIRSYETDWR